MNRRNLPGNDQPTLFDAYSSQHDYGGASDTGDAGHEYPFVQAREIDPGAHVSLEDRATALGVIMGYYNKRNMTRGSKKQLVIPGSDFTTRYEYPGEVQRGAERKTQELYQGYIKAIDTLAGVESMLAAGEHWSDVEVNWIKTKKEINDEFLDKNATPRERKAAVNQAKRTADRVVKGQDR